eukprot:maker-scaffold93_size381549-snap-gene-2.23 protein:Tk04400 transcript:maker-scaffold93_size381549-snap-gene-2.23-mRNA-1 annotation:"neuropathy target esterase sws isoform x4"
MNPEWWAWLAGAAPNREGSMSVPAIPVWSFYEDSRWSDVILTSLLGLLAGGFVLLWLEYNRLKAKYRGRQMANVMMHEGPKEVKEHLQEAIHEMADFVLPNRSQRFRKRDRMAFHGRKMMRRISSNMRRLSNVSHDPQERQKAINRLTRRFLRPDSDQDQYSDSGSGLGIGPAEEYLDEDDSSEQGEPWVSEELNNLLNGFHMFSHFDKTMFFELCQSLEVLHIPAGQYLFRVGDPDIFIYVVQSGRMNVYIVDSENRTTSIKYVTTGETVSSLLSFIEVLTGHPGVYKTVCCKAISDSVILKLPAEAFQKVFNKNPEVLIRVVQLSMARLQRVTFMALHQYLGLSSELIRDIHQDDLSNDSLSFEEEGQLIPLRSHLAPEAAADHEEALMNLAVRGFQSELDIHQEEFLRDRIEIRTLETGHVIMTEDSHNDAALVFILSGSLLMSQKGEQDGNPDLVLYAATRGECVGQLAMLTGEANFYSCKARENSIVAILTREAFFTIVCESPELILSLSRQCIKRLSPMVRQVDFALDWLNIESGKALYRQSDPTDGTYIVLSGRLRAIMSSLASGGRKKMVDEYTIGHMVGLVDVVTTTSRLTTVVAVRDSELCKIPSSLLNLLKQRYPVVVSRLISLLGHRLLGTWSNNGRFGHQAAESDTMEPSYTTVALFPSSSNIPTTAVALEMVHALSIAGPTARLTSGMIKHRLGPSAFESSQDFRLNAWLAQQEHRHKVVLYQCDPEMTPWTKRCLRQADVILDVAIGGDDPYVTAFERELEKFAKRTRKELVMLHAESTVYPTGTREWLRKRPWISSHFHIKAPKRIFLKKSETRMIDFYLRHVQNQAPNIHSDFSRLARHITGTSVGLVLGGGGAKGASHVGMLKAIGEANIPIDRVGGVSIGCFVGGLWSQYRDIATVTQKAREWFLILGQKIVGPMLDLTYPVTSLFTGAYFNSTLYNLFGTELGIEDLWLPFFCCTTDITLSQERVHTKGTFWSYCRASMSYAWLLPPLCDPVDGHLLMDGCYVNNVPGDVMANQGCKYILAIDVIGAEDRDLYNYGDALSGWWVLWRKLNPFSSAVKIPDQSDIQVRLAFCSHYKNLEELKNNSNYEYIQPPTDKYTSSQFALFDEIREVGYHHGNTFFTGLRKAGQLHQQQNPSSYGQTSTPVLGTTPPWMPGAAQASHWARARTALKRRDSGSYSFTDLAALVCQNIREGNNELNQAFLPMSRGSSSSRLRSRANSSASGMSGSGNRKRHSSGRSHNRRLGKVSVPSLARIQNPDHALLSDDGSDDTGIVL